MGITVWALALVWWGAVAALAQAAEKEFGPQPQPDPPIGVAVRLTTATLVFKGKDQIILTWESNVSAPAKDAVTILYSVNKGFHWEEAVRGVPDRGQAAWAVPNVPARYLRFKLLITDEVGGVFVDETPDDYRILVSYPIGVLLSPKKSDKGRVTFSYFIDKSERVGSVELWGRLERAAVLGPWRFIKRDSDRISPIAAELPDGIHEFRLLVFDDKGSGPPKPTGRQRGQLTTLVDTRPPMVVLKNFHAGIHPGGKERYISYDVQDDHLTMFPIDIDISSDDGTNWTAVEHGLPNQGSLLFTLPLAEDGK